MTETVECYSGAQYAEKPRALHWQGQRMEISAIQAKWRTPVSHCFRVKTQDAQQFELAYFDLNNEWTIHPL